MVKKELMFGLLLVFSMSVFAANCGGSTPCSCGDTITSSRVLDSSDSLTGCGGVAALYMNPIGSFTLDCNGTNITGSSNRALEGNRESGVTVKNCNFQGFGTSIFFSSIKDSFIINNTFDDAPYGDIFLAKYGSAFYGSDNVAILGNDFVSAYIRISSSTGTIVDGNHYVDFDEVAEGCTGMEFCNEPYITGGLTDYHPISINGEGDVITPELSHAIVGIMAVILTIYVVGKKN